MAFLFALSSITSVPTLPAAGVSDKIVHGLLYAVLGALLARAIGGGRAGPVRAGTVAAAVFWSAVYGVSDEIHQHFVPPRTMEAVDVAADAIGAAVGAAAYACARAAASRRRETPSRPSRVGYNSRRS
jgi:VanZ family protein